ncbi:telomerase-binding protein EST1A isoform X2 [Drosophila tropicalis]|uniref:telomerase-binding protein EST1A isoform X2 n=1 Tax=Drosophila tropicalis TaxID=46794 RepID=UPI0035ABE189
MSRRATQDQNDISRIIGALPKRLQRKIAENAGETTATRPTMTTTSRPITILTKSSLSTSTASVGDQAKPLVKVPILQVSEQGNKPMDKDVAVRCVGSSNCIPGILRVTAPSVAPAATAHSGRRRRRQHHVGKDKEQKPMSPLPRVRLTTDHPEWFENLLTMPQDKKIIQFYDQLMVLQQRNLILINWKNFCCLHVKLQDCFKRLLLEQLKFVCEHKVDAFFWKLLFYNVREYMMRQHSELANTHILLLMEQTIKFYHVVYEKLMVKYKAASRCESAAKVVGQRLLICLGDLARYRANHLQTSDYLEAGKYYQKAQELLPGNGTPYNQLAVIAIYHHKRFDAVYYYMRSLLSSNSVQTAKESLLDLFDEIRRKYDDTEMKQSPMHCASNTSAKKANKQMRKEVWIYPDGIRCLHRTNVKPKIKNKATPDEVNRYDEMPTEELMLRILSLYLYLIGKLYTGTDVDCLYLLLRKFQIQLSAALKYDNLLTRSKLLKMVALNVFVIEHNKRSTRREMRYHSFNFANSFFGLMLGKVNQLLSGILEESVDFQSIPDEEFTLVNTYLQFVRKYVRWLTTNVNLWEPVRTEEHSFIDCWLELQTLFDNIECINGKFPNKFDNICSTIVLDEDVVLSGFDPLGRECVSREGNQRDSERNQFLERIGNIAEFQYIYKENQKALQQPLDSNFTIEDINAAMKVALNCFDVTDAADVNNCPVEHNENDCEIQDNLCPSMDADVTELCRLKKELEAKAKVKQICSTRLEEILKFVDTKLYIEVRPRYLLPDTNCFIDCLEDIEKLSMDYKRYTLVIPLTVVKELDGLSKGVKLDSSRSFKQTKRIHHFDEVSSRAKKSMEFIKSAKNNVKCATTKGSFVNASVFALVEEEYLSNDDKILATAVAVSKTTSSEQCRDGKCFIQTELVLITTDRNLRVKALTRNLAVSGLDEFLQWAKDSSEST